MEHVMIDLETLAVAPGAPSSRSAQLLLTQPRAWAKNFMLWSTGKAALKSVCMRIGTRWTGGRSRVRTPAPCCSSPLSLKPQIKMARQGTYHNALDDAKSQALHAIQLMG